jgi:dTDP-4-amino-4,6-dideoxygalactose transaminase
VFCDVDPETMMVTAETVKARITANTRAVIAVHLFGNIAPVAEIEALGVPVLEDAAQAAGSRGVSERPGALGTAATFSFYPSKNLGCLGDGGAIATSDGAVAELARTLRFHGSRDQRSWELIGYNSRLDALQAAFLRVLLPELDGWAESRFAAGRAYEAAGLGELVSLPHPTAGALAAWHVYVIRSPHVDAIARALNEAGIGAKVYYRPGLHRAPALAQWHDRGELPATEELSRTHLAIPIGPRVGEPEAATVTARVREALADVAR